MKNFRSWKSGKRFFRGNGMKRGRGAARMGGEFSLRHLARWMARLARGSYAAMLPAVIPARAARVARDARRALAEAVRAPVERLEQRMLMSGIVYVNDNWVGHSPTNGTVQNTGLGDDGSLSGLTLGTNAFNSLGTALTAAAAPANGITEIVVVSGSYGGGTNMDINVPGVTVEGWSAFSQQALASNPDPSHVSTGSINTALQSILDTSTYTIDAANVTVEGFYIVDSSATSGDGGIVTKGTATGFTISANNFSSNSVGVAVEGGTGAISGNTFTGNTTGIKFTAGSASVSGGSFTGGTTGIDIAGGTASVSGVTFAGTVPTYISNESGAEVSAIGNTFNGVNTGLPGTTLAQFYAVEDKITDGLDAAGGSGLVRLKAGNVYVSQNSGSIQRGVNVAVAGDVVNVQAGTFQGDVIVNKGVDLQGAYAGTAGSAASGTSPARNGAETEVLPDNGTQSAVFTVASSNVTIDGFLIEGSVTATAVIPLTSGDVTSALYGIRAASNYSGVTVQNDVVRDFDIGFFGSGAASGNLITKNWFDSIGFYDFGYAVDLQNSFYTDVTDNLMTRAVGSQDE